MEGNSVWMVTAEWKRHHLLAAVVSADKSCVGLWDRGHGTGQERREQTAEGTDSWMES